MDETRSPLTRPTITPNRAQRRAAARRRVTAVGSAAVLASTAAAFVTGTAGVASAAGYSVTTCADTGVGSLRQAIYDANVHDGPDVITITATCTVSGPVAVGSLMDVTDSGGGDGITIVGPGADSFVLDGGGSSQIFYVGDRTDFSLSGVTMQHAASSAVRGNGAGAIVFDGVVFADNSGFGGAGMSGYHLDSVTITDTTFVGNASTVGAGGLYLQNAGPITISSSTFADNTAGGNGGGILIYTNHDDVEIANSTFSGNTGARGGGLYADLFGDPSPDAGLEIVFCTFADNVATTGAGGGLNVRYADAVTMIGTAFAGNAASTAGTDEVYTSVVPTEHDNLFEGDVDGFTPDASDLTGVDPLFGALADNGGPTQTRALGAGSPAIDAGPTSFPSFPGDTSDQRGEPYLRTYGGRSDIGAFEAQPEPTPPGPGPGPAPQPEPEPEPEPTFTG